jgi:hypothetical protein
MIIVLGVVGENHCRKSFISAKHAVHLGIAIFLFLRDTIGIMIMDLSLD